MMKKMLILAAFLFAATACVPFAGLYLRAQRQLPMQEAVLSEDATEIALDENLTATAAEPTEGINDAQQEEILVCMADSGVVEEMELIEYTIGVVAAEMPALYEAEALKAQAAASMNLARRAIAEGTSERFNGGHISSSSSVSQAYLTHEQMRYKWGDDYEVYYNKIKNAVSAVAPYMIMYEDELCMTVFHAMSAGRTENSENVWVSALPYLTAADSSFDSSADSFTVSVRIEADAFAKGLEVYGFEPTQNARHWLGESVYSDSGTLLSLQVGEITVSGQQVRSAFGLRSAAVSVVYEDGEFVLTTKGYGHGVGMSQYGAQQLALQGKTWQEIIKHYYKGVSVVERDGVLG
ncbi:MAG: stage II sporulation protein D [Clostridia bacterium]|nr:stage II sporulation protein D [Clostridia bacterium]